MLALQHAEPTPMNPDARQSHLRRLAWACLLLMLVVTTASAWLRLMQPRPVCDDWPACRGAESVGTMRAAEPVAAVRWLHRGAASSVLLLVIGVAVVALRHTPRQLEAGVIALLLLALALALSVLGIITPGSRSSAVLLGNLVGGFVMLALSGCLLRRLYPCAPPSRALAGWAMAGALLWAAQVSLGALSGVGRSEVLPLLHVAVGLIGTALGAAVAWAAFGQRRRLEGGALLVIAALQPVLGVGAAALAAAPMLVLVHNLSAALGLALLFGLGFDKRQRLPGGSTSRSAALSGSPSDPGDAGHPPLRRSTLPGLVAAVQRHRSAGD